MNGAQSRNYPEICGSFARWASIKGVMRDYHILQEQDFLSEIQGLQGSGKQRYEALIAEGWIARIHFREKRIMRCGNFIGKDHYAITYGKRMAPYGRPESRVSESVLLHLMVTAQYRHCLPRGRIKIWHNEIRLKEAHPDLVKKICNGYAPDALLAMQNGEYWGVELLKKTISNSQREWEKKNSQWRNAGMAKIIWLRLHSPWKKPPFYVFDPPAE